MITEVQLQAWVFTMDTFILRMFIGLVYTFWFLMTIITGSVFVGILIVPIAITHVFLEDDQNNDN